MPSRRAKRFLFVLAFLGAAAFATVALFAFLLTRDMPFNWEQANRYEAAVAESKLRFYDEAIRSGETGYIRLSSVEINSYIRTFLTNEFEADLKKVGVAMSKTNLLLYSWGETKCLGVPVRFVVERGFNLRNGATNISQLAPAFIRVGHLDIKPEYWPRLQPILEKIDAPLMNRFAWLTNVKTFLITKNELSQRPELRLYNYDPFATREVR